MGGTTGVIMKILSDHCFSINKGGQGYDIGANMKRKDKSAQKKITRLGPLAFFVHSERHSYNLVLCDAAV